MSGPVELAFSRSSSSPRLPAIGDDTNLVSQPIAKPLFGRDEHENSKKVLLPEDEEINREKGKLKKLLTRAFITALHRNTENQCWNHLREVLEIAEPYLSILRTKELQHYAERSFLEIQGKKDLVNVCSVLQRLFVDVISKVQITDKRKSKYPSSLDEETSPTCIKKDVAKKGVRVPNVDMKYSFPPTLCITSDDKPVHHHKHAKELSLNDLRLSLAEVVKEISARESVLGVPLGMTILALDINLSPTHTPSPPSTPKPSTITTIYRECEQADKKLSNKKEITFIPRSGMEIVEQFIKGSFLGDLKFAYVNIAPSDRYNPYNLIEVQKDGLNPEHFVISSHSILHVSPNGPSESQLISDWYIEASTFHAVMNLSLFKNFFLRKAFMKLKNAKKFTYFRKTKGDIEKSLIQNIQTFGSALLRISSLLNDLSKVTFLPFDTKSCYNLSEFEELTFKASYSGRMYVNKFFAFCQMIVDKTQSNCFEYLKYCENQIKSHHHNYKESLAVAKEKKAVRQKNLRLAHEEVAMLGNFVNLVDHIIIQNLITLAQANICRFVDVTLPGPQPDREALFQADIIFTDNNKLALSPSPKQIAHSLSSALEIVLSVMCNLSHAMKLDDETKSFINTKISVAKTPRTTDSVRPDTTAQFSSRVDAVSERGKKDQYSYSDRRSSNNSSAASPNMRSEDEIFEDIQDFNTSIESARKLKATSQVDLCSKQPQETVLVIQGQKIQQHSVMETPLTKEKLQQMLYNNDKIKDALKYHEEFVSEAVEEVTEFCNNHDWLSEIHHFVTGWDDSQMDYWKSQPTAMIEQQLRQIQSWVQQVAGVIRKFTTANGLLYINCISIQDVIVPKLTSIFNQMVTMVASQVLVLSEEVVTEMEELALAIKEQRTEIKFFALFIKNLKEVKTKVPALKDKVEYIKNLFEVIRGCFRQLSAEEEITEEKVWSCWESFLFSLQEASDFIQMQKPVVTERISEAIANMEEQVFGIGHRATSGQFIDPDEVPSRVLADLRQLRDRGRKICNDLTIIKHWKAIITGSEYDMTEVLNIMESIEKRLELWRYYELCCCRIKDWSNSAFVKLHVKRIVDTVQDWVKACDSLKDFIDEEDNVLNALFTKLHNFSRELPLLLQLSDESLKQRHWRTLFIGMGHEFDHSMKFTTKQLLEMNLARFKDLIQRVCSGAAHENDLENELQSLIKSWVDREFKLAKHIPFMRPRMDEGQHKKTDKQKKNKARGNAKTPAALHDSFIVIGIPELKCMIEDNLVSLQSMLASPYVMGVIPLVEEWIDNLTELEDILNIWENCQNKWLYLTNVFSEPQMVKKYADDLETFKKINQQYKVFIDGISKNSRVTYVLTKPRGDLQWRELQGETLRVMLLELISVQEQLIMSVREYFELARAEFPRLYLLGDRALLDLLAWSRNPKDLLPFVKMCFPGIKGLQFKLPDDVSVKLTSALDAALNVHLLEAIGMEGNHNEEVSFVQPIPPSPVPQKWLINLEQAMRNSLMNELANCVRTILNDGPVNFTSLVEHFIERENTDSEDNAVEALESSSLVDFPAQCIEKAEAVLWARKVKSALVTGRQQELSSVRTVVKTSIEDLASAIRKSIEHPTDCPQQKRLEIIASNLLTQATSHRDIIDDLIEDHVTSGDSFEWQSQLRSEMEITEEISTSYDGNSGDISSDVQVEKRYRVGKCSVEQLGTSDMYGYEYLGPTTGLVITPLARRCFLSLNMALRSFKCGVLHGPNGTGKTETIHHLSKILGRHLVTINCTSSLESSTLISYLSGILRSGSWICLENIDNMKSGVLSVFGQHMEKIRISLQCIKRDVHSQYTVRGNTNKKSEHRPSMVTLTPLHGEQSTWIKDEICQEINSRPRRLSSSEAGNFLDTLSEPSSTLDKTYQDIRGVYRYRTSTPLTFTMPEIGQMVFNNKLIGVSEMYGCFMTMSSYKNTYAEIPHNLKALLRPIAMVVPNARAILEVTMSSCGFTESALLAKKLRSFFNMISDQMASENDVSLRSMRTVIRFASYQLRKELKKKSIKDSSVDHSDGASSRSPFLESFERRQTEENSVVYALFIFFGNRLGLLNKEIFSKIVDSVFVHSVLMSVISEGEPELCDNIEEHFLSYNFQVKPELIAKTVQLYKSIKSTGNVIVIGSSGSGKTTLCQALAGAINNLHAQLVSHTSNPTKPRKTATVHEELTADCGKAWPMLDVTVVFPKSLTNEELFGYRDSSTSVWRDGLISKFLRDSTLTSRTKNDVLKMTLEEKQRTLRGLKDVSLVEKWLVLDGPMDELWLGGMSTVLDSSKTLSLGEGGSIAVPDTVSIIFETTDLSNVTPSLVTCCSIVHCSDDLIAWKAIFRPWIKSAHSKWEISNRGLGIISSLMDHAVEVTLQFLQTQCKTILTADFGSTVSSPSPARGVYEVQSFLRYLSAIFDRHIIREVDTSQLQVVDQQKRAASATGSASQSRHSSGLALGDTDKVIATFVFAFVWAFGGHLHHRYAQAFDEHARKLLSSGPYPANIPEEGLVYDYYLDFSRGTLIKWEERPGAQFKTFASSYTVVPEFDRYFFLMDLMITAGQPVLLMGQPGSGKSALVQNLVSPRHSHQRIFMSTALTSNLFQEAIESKLAQVERREMSGLIPREILPSSNTKSKSVLYFLDDLNYANVDKYNTQPPLELLRQILAQGCLYDKQRQQFYPVKNNVQFMCTAVTPSATGVGGGVASHILNPCLTRLMTTLSFFPASTNTLTVIYSGIFLTWLKSFPAYSMTHHAAISKAMATATIHLYNKIREELRPSPLYPHFIFNQNDLARIADSFTLFSASSRGRKRPRVRKRGGGGGRTVRMKHTNMEEMTGVYRESHYGYDGDPTVATPALLSPIIRSLFRLWCHENTRTYCDRLLNDDQRFWFSSVLHEIVMEHFCQGVEEMPSDNVQQEIKSLFPMMSRESIGVVPGTSAPPPSAKVSRSNIDGKNEEDKENSDQDDDELLLDNENKEINEQNDLADDKDDNEMEIHDHEEIVIDEGDTEPVDDGAPNEEMAGNKDVDLERPTSSVDSIEEITDQAECTFSAKAPKNENAAGVSKNVDDRDYKGPLITLKQLASPGEDLTDIVFCKHFISSNSNLSTASSSSNTTRGYTECSQDDLELGMKKCLNSYNSQTIKDESFKKINMVAFREALCHASRISRALVMEGGHALLLSHQGYGRRTLTRLAAYAARYTLVEVQTTPFQGQGELRQQIKEASYIAGLQGKPVVLFVPEDQTDGSLQDICTVMVEGTCPGLYTKNELNMITSNLLPVGQREIRRAEHLDIAQERFFRRVKSHLHVVICMKYEPLVPSKPPSQSQLYRFPILLTRCCCVDTFLPWPHEALASIAEKLIDLNESNQTTRKKKDHITQPSAVGTAICSIMAHVYLSSRAMVQRVYGPKGLKLCSPDSYLDFVILFKKFHARICQKEKANVERLTHGIRRMEEANGTIKQLNNELKDLDPVYEEAQQSVKRCHDEVENGQAEYHSQKEACKKKELEIQELKVPVNLLKKETSEEFGKVSPLFSSAYNAINALDVRNVEEIRSYRVPPYLVELVVKCICLLFKTPQTWSEGKLLLNRDNFFKDLEFYNMKAMPDSMFNHLKEFYNNPSFKPNIVKSGSEAAGSLCMWARAVYEYCVVYRTLKPKRMELKQAETELDGATTALGEMRVRYNEIKKDLEQRIQAYKESMKHLKNTEKKMQLINGRKSRAEDLVNSMTEYSKSWQKCLDESAQNLVTARGDALMMAASVCYLGPLDQNARQVLFNDWLRVCDGKDRASSNTRSSLLSKILHNAAVTNKEVPQLKSPSKSRNVSPITAPSRNSSSIPTTDVIPVRDNLSLANALAEKDELVEWARRGLPTDEHAIQNALIMRMCLDREYCWPLLIDPHGQTETWVHAVVDVKPNNSTIINGSKSRGSGIQSRPSTPLDYQELEATEEDISIAGDIEDSVESNADDQSVVLGGRDSVATDKSTDMSDKTFKDRIAKEMGIQSPEVPSISTATPSLEVREGQVMVLSADDSQLVSKIRAAVIAGVVVLITHMERRRLSKKLELLLARQTYMEKNERKIAIGKSKVTYHPSFRLFFSSSMPLYMKGEGLVPLPFSKACVVDMSFSQQGLTNRLLMETLTLERPEYEGQKRSLERDVTLHQQQILTAQAFVLDKVLELKTALLSDPNISSNVKKSKDIINTARSRYEEAQAMEKQLHEKRADFLPVASYGSMLYTVICLMHKVHPYCYYTPLDTFLKLFHDTILHRKRNKKSIGSSAARAAELTSALSRAVYTRISWGLFLSDNLLFPFLISIEKLLNEGGVQEDEWKVFISHPPKPEFLKTVDKECDKPAWVTQEAWSYVNELELLPSLANLRSSLIDFTDEWREYFLLPPVLLANTPGDLPHLTVFQKALLWKVFRKDQVHMICKDLVLYILGASMVHPIEYDLQQVFSVCDNTLPIVFLLPSHEDVSNGVSVSIKDPYNDIFDLARSHQKGGWIKTVCLGESNAMEQALHAVRYGMDHGQWVVINNAHLADEWSNEFIETLQLITNTCQAIDDSEDDDVSVWTGDPELQTPISQNRLSVIHPEFRLFVITRVGTGRSLPAVLIQRGLKLACESKANHRSTLSQTLDVGARSISNWTTYWNEPFCTVIKSTLPQYAFYAMAYLHSTLHYRRQYGLCAFTCPYEWNCADIHASSDVLRHLSCVLHQDCPVQMDKLLDMLAKTVYTGHVFDKMDFLAVRSIARFLSSSQSLKTTIDCKDTVDELLQNFPESLSFEELGLTQSSVTRYYQRQSSELMMSLQTVMEAKHSPFSLDEVVHKIKQLKTIIIKLSSEASVPDQTDKTTTMSAFFHQEILFYKNFLSQILKELNLLSMAVEGYITITPFLHDVMVDIHQSILPIHWYNQCGGPCDLGLWITWISSRVSVVQEYSVCTPAVVSLGVLTHQQAFLSCVMIDHVKSATKSLHSLIFHMEVMPIAFKPKTTPDNGIYVSGLSVCNASWDSERRCLIGGSALVTELPIVLLTLQSETKTITPGSDLVMYDCPLRSNVTGDHLIHLPLISVLSIEELWKRKVYLVT